MEFKGTKGKWFYQEDSDAYTHIVRPENNPCQIIVHGPQITSGYAEANLRLIAAAPELLEALKLAVKELKTLYGMADNGVIEVCQSTINKALN